MILKILAWIIAIPTFPIIFMVIWNTLLALLTLEIVIVISLLLFAFVGTLIMWIFVSLLALSLSIRRTLIYIWEHLRIITFNRNNGIVLLLMLYYNSN